MENYETFAKLEEMRQQTAGNPQKIAEFNVKKAEFNKLVGEHFNEEHPFTHSFNESYLESLKKYAEENPDDASAQFRYGLQKERYEVNEAKKTGHVDLKLANRTLREKISSGNVTKADLEQAAILVKRNGSEDNRVIYATIKKLIND
ncbi:hypothetical protein V7075_07820 [Neobacillus drentensis]|uniref:hypothetical protein n=1 Tax=Neobacillus drentensis TaxID=220684 RepID=UPI002FFE2887